MHRSAVAAQFELRSGGEVPFGSWLAKQRAAGMSLRALADRIQQETGCAVSHEAVRLWLREG